MSSTLDPDLADLRERWSPAWSIWRAKGSRDPATMMRREGSYCASRIDDSAGLVPFLMARSPIVLNDALEAQTAAVLAGATTAPEPGILS